MNKSIPVESGMKLVYLAHPVRGKDFIATEANLARAKRWLEWASIRDPLCAVIAPWITICEIFDDSDPANRAHGFKCNLTVIERCDEIWLCGGRVSDGMMIELDHATKHGLILRDFTRLGKEPPNVEAAIKDTRVTPIRGPFE